MGRTVTPGARPPAKPGWHRGALCAGDTETDGKYPRQAHLITATLVRLTSAGPRYGEWVAQPSRPIPDEAAEVHGYPTERAQAEGRPRAEVLAEINNWLIEHWCADRPLIMFNAPFDLTLLDREYRRELGHGLDVRGPVIDPLVLDRQMDRYRAGKRTLGTTCPLYGVTLSERDAHSSLGDTFACGRLATAVVDWYPRFRKMTPAQLHTAQIDWKREQAESLLEHWRSKPWKHPEWRDSGETPPQDVIDSWHVDTDWPMIPYDPAAEDLHEEAVPA